MVAEERLCENRMGEKSHTLPLPTGLLAIRRVVGWGRCTVEGSRPARPSQELTPLSVPYATMQI